MQVTVAKSAGFCFGVRRAVDMAQSLVREAEGDIYTLGPIIHNEEVVEELKQRGVLV
ncbi:MAG: 4-hydroxy-3-methylbut-2-enyl diphosphate reductase, partial [Lachnospiraceae bacterium]|nr:4-hydroxy-3-methylbut-2-enyl diphosphate reductase [Lachnospiraceae bacterium]